MAVVAPKASSRTREKSDARAKIANLKRKLETTMAQQKTRSDQRSPEEQVELDKIAKGLAREIPRVLDEDR